MAQILARFCSADFRSLADFGSLWRRRGAPATLATALLVLVIAALGVLAGCQPAPSSGPVTPAVPRPTPQAMTLTVLHTNDTWGYLLPCG